MAITKENLQCVGNNIFCPILIGCLTFDLSDVQPVYDPAALRLAREITRTVVTSGVLKVLNFTRASRLEQFLSLIL